MEIYHFKIRWLGCIFLIPVAWLLLSLAGFTSFEIRNDETIVAYIVIAICSIVSLQCFLGSTRFYFDNSSRNGVQVRKHFYGEKVIYIPYSDITAIAIRSYRTGNDSNIKYRVGLIEKTIVFGQTTEKFTTLRSYSGKENSLDSAKTLGEEICSYTKLNIIDDSKTIRPDSDISSASFRV